MCLVFQFVCMKCFSIQLVLNLLFSLCLQQGLTIPIAISLTLTLTVENFFSDLTRFEISGLGALKSVEIPKLIMHIVHINAMKHDPNRGFKLPMLLAT